MAELLDDDDRALIAHEGIVEEQVLSNVSAEELDTRDREKTLEEISNYLKKHNPQPMVRGRKDAVDDRYIIKYNEAVPGLGNTIAKACRATDEQLPDRNLFALVIPRDVPYRLRPAQQLAGFDHPNILPLVAVGNVEFSQDQQCRRAMVMEMPKGKSLRQLLTERKTPLTEKFVLDDVIAPLTDALRVFRELGISHGKINIDNVFLGDKVQLGECFSEPPGFSQHFLFESAERAQASALGKGEPEGVAADCYALGMLAMHLLVGLRAFERMTETEFMSKRLTLGTYNALVTGKDFKLVEDFLKGVLNDNPLERWTPDIIEPWLQGKKSNLLTPSILRESQRSVDYLGESFFNRRALAQKIYKHWDESKTALRANTVSRWIEVSLHKNAIADEMRRVVDKTGGINSISEKANSELVARTICVLDPEGPVRYNMISAFADGIGLVLAEAFRLKDQKMIQTVIEVLDYNFFGYANDFLEEEKAKRNGQLLWKIQNAGKYLRMQAMGFGIERALYELNPTLPCQSPMLAGENVLTIDDLLNALDRMGTRKNRGSEYLDRHIAAFVSTKIDSTKEVKLNDLHLVPALAQNPQLIVLYLLSQAQRKVGRPKLKGLSSWAALRILPLIDNFHSRTLRKRIREGLRTAAKSGDLEKIFDVLMDQRSVAENHTGFQQAVHRFTRNAHDIAKRQNRKRLKDRAEKIGTMFAIIIAYTAVLISISKMVKEVFYGS